MTPRNKRTCLIGATLLCVGAAIPVALGKLPDLWNARPAGGRHFGPNADFILTTLGSFFGGIYYLNAFDVILGIGGILLVVWGVTTALRNSDTRPLGIAVLTVALVCVLPFSVISVRQYFSPRYIAPALVPLLTGIALLSIFAGRMTKPSCRIVTVLIFVYIALHAGRSFRWLGQKNDGQFQPTNQVIPALRRVAKPDAILLTRFPYSSLGLRFLWNREKVDDHELVALSYFFNRGAPTIQEARELISSNPNREVYFASLIEDEERHARDFVAWLKENSELVETLPSNCTDPYVPINWTIRLYRLKKETTDPFALPRAGSAASNVYPELNVSPIPSQSPDAPLTLQPGCGASWNFRASKQESGLTITLNRTGHEVSRSVVYIDDLAPFILNVPPSKDPFQIHLPVEIQPGIHRLDIVYTSSWWVKELSAKRLIVDSIDFLRPTDKINESLFRRMKEIDVVKDNSDLILGPDELGKMGTPSVLFDRPIDLSSHVIADNALVLVGERFHPKGLGDRMVNVELKAAGPEYRSMHWSIGWSHGEARCATVVPGNMLRGEVRIRARLLDRYDFRPRNAHLEMKPIRVYIEEKNTP